uniref:Uncharacterized protein n=1 Tax=Molossus molossus TaxID=27622 RepID=A0A7J8DC13_MOLMO|nr:hypothetical protein HJG59_009391 [Molossus molossus]
MGKASVRPARSGTRGLSVGRGRLRSVGRLWGFQRGSHGPVGRKPEDGTSSLPCRRRETAQRLLGPELLRALGGHLSPTPNSFLGNLLPFHLVGKPDSPAAVFGKCPQRKWSLRLKFFCHKFQVNFIPTQLLI